MAKHSHTMGSRKLGKRLRKWRESREETLQHVADGARLSKSHVWELEQGRNTNPTIGVVMALAKHFGASIDALVKP